MDITWKVVVMLLISCEVGDVKMRFRHVKITLAALSRASDS
jgi:hypothetical protein